MQDHDWLWDGRQDADQGLLSDRLRLKLRYEDLKEKYAGLKKQKESASHTSLQPVAHKSSKSSSSQALAEKLGRFASADPVATELAACRPIKATRRDHEKHVIYDLCDELVAAKVRAHLWRAECEELRLALTRTNMYVNTASASTQKILTPDSSYDTNIDGYHESKPNHSGDAPGSFRQVENGNKQRELVVVEERKVASPQRHAWTSACARPTADWQQSLQYDQLRWPPVHPWQRQCSTPLQLSGPTPTPCLNYQCTAARAVSPQRVVSAPPRRGIIARSSSPLSLPPPVLTSAPPLTPASDLVRGMLPPRSVAAGVLSVPLSAAISASIPSAVPPPMGFGSPDLALR